MRRMAMVMVVAVMAGGLVGCGGGGGADGDGGDGGGRASAERSATTVKDAASTLFPAIAAAVRAVGDPPSADGRYAICGMEPSPSGVTYSAETALPQTDTAGSAQGEAIAEALESDGWAVTSSTGSALTATKDGMSIRATFGGAISLQLRSACVDAPKDTIRSLTDRSIETIDLS